MGPGSIRCVLELYSIEHNIRCEVVVFMCSSLQVHVAGKAALSLRRVVLAVAPSRLLVALGVECGEHFACVPAPLAATLCSKRGLWLHWAVLGAAIFRVLGTLSWNHFTAEVLMLVVSVHGFEASV